MKRWTWAAVLLVALTLAACGGGGEDGNGGEGDGDDGTTISLQGKEFEFIPSEVSGPADTEVTVELENVGTIEHDFTLDEANLTVLAPATETATGSFTLSAGTYTFYCSIPGHRESGMEGTLTLS